MSASRFLGIWRLVSYTRRQANGTVDHPYTEQPIGRLTYDPAGRMSAQLMRPGRRSTLPSGVSFALANASDVELREAASGFIAYYGRFDVDEAAEMVIHHVDACLVPSWVGTDLRRQYRFNGDRLFLRAEAAGQVVDLEWQREA